MHEDSRLLKLIKAFYIASGGTYGSPWIHADLREAGEQCRVNHVAKIMRQHIILKRKLGINVAISQAVRHRALQIIYWHTNLTHQPQINRG